MIHRSHGTILFFLISRLLLLHCCLKESHLDPMRPERMPAVGKAFDFTNRNVPGGKSLSGSWTEAS